MSRRTTALLGVVILLLVAVFLMRMNFNSTKEDASNQISTRQAQIILDLTTTP